MRPGETFGELTLIDGSPRGATAIAREPTEVAVIDERAFHYLVERNPPFALDLLRRLIATPAPHERKPMSARFGDDAGSGHLVVDVALAAHAEVAGLRVQDLGEDLGAVDEARARPVEVGVAVGKEHLLVPHRAQLLPDGVAGERPHLALRRLDVIAARRDHDHVGIGGGDFLPGDPRRGFTRRRRTG